MGANDAICCSTQQKKKQNMHWLNIWHSNWLTDEQTHRRLFIHSIAHECVLVLQTYGILVMYSKSHTFNDIYCSESDCCCLSGQQTADVDIVPYLVAAQASRAVLIESHVSNSYHCATVTTNRTIHTRCDSCVRVWCHTHMTATRFTMPHAVSCTTVLTVRASTPIWIYLVRWAHRRCQLPLPFLLGLFHFQTNLRHSLMLYESFSESCRMRVFLCETMCSEWISVVYGASRDNPTIARATIIGYQNIPNLLFVCCCCKHSGWRNDTHSEWIVHIHEVFGLRTLDATRDIRDTRNTRRERRIYTLIGLVDGIRCVINRKFPQGQQRQFDLLRLPNL